MKMAPLINDILNRFYKKRQRKIKQLIGLFSISLLIALLSHLFFISKWCDGQYMLGTNDGLSQMLPFKQLLYKGYSSGNFFYSTQFGMGGGTYSQLGYYFSNSIFFLITVTITFVLESMNVIQKPTLIYWADLILIISVIRMTLIIFVTTMLFGYINLQMIPAFVGAITYGTSIIYFRHVTYWEFFVDAMLWLPLLLFGIEKIIKEKKPLLFVIAVAISLFDNFYFSYINILLAGLYTIFRFFIPLFPQETSKLDQIKLYLLSGLAGFGISAVSFIPIVYGYFNNHPIPFEETIPLFGFEDSLLWNSRVVAMPTFVLLCLFIKSYYRNYLFRLFACVTILSIILHFSPMVASAFNGFSALQYRWEYFLSLMAGGIVATGLQHIKLVSTRQAMVSIIYTVFIYFISFVGYITYFRMVKRQWSIFSLKGSYLVIAAVITIIVFGLYHIYKKRLMYYVFCVTLVFTSLYTSNFYQKVKLWGEGSAHASKQVMTSDAYNGKDQNELIHKIKQREQDSFYRIDWMIETRNNTPIVQDFNGFSVYSSILNKYLLYYYLFELEIDMGRESASRYMTLGDRANLHSLLRGKYYIREKEKKAIPYGFEEILTVGNYIAYGNKNVLPFFRVTNTVFTEEDLKQSSAIVKERAMLLGVILSDEYATVSNTPIPENQSLINDVHIDPISATYYNDVLYVKGDNGGIDLVLNDSISSSSDLYVSFYLKRFDQDKGYNLQVNDYVTTRKKRTSIYKTGVNQLTIRAPVEKRISIRVPRGKYELADIDLYEDDYTYLNEAKKESSKMEDVIVNWAGHKVNIIYDNKGNDQFGIVPIPFEKGWTLRINGDKEKVLRANYAFIGFTLQEGNNHIELIYYPPYFYQSILISIASLIFALLLVRIRDEKNFTKS